MFHRHPWAVLPTIALAIVLLAGCNQASESPGDSGDSHEGHAHAMADAADAADAGVAVCESHGMVDAQCPFCHPELIEELGMCGGHGIPEAICFPCNPALEVAFRATGDWCAGHDRPESQCYLCNPELDPARLAHAERPAGDGGGGPVAADPGAPSGPDTPRHLRAPSVYCTTQDALVRFDSPRVAADVGLEFATAERREITATIECNAVVDYDGDRHVHLASQVGGVIAQVHSDFGEPLSTGDPLVTITSPHLGAAKAALLQAQAAVRLWEKNHAREEDLLRRGVATEVKVLEAETELAESRIAFAAATQGLLSLGLTQRQIDRVAETGDTGTRHLVSAPFDGVVVDRDVVVGEVVEPGQVLYEIADVSRMWVRLDVYESDAAGVRAGQPVVVRVDGLRGEAFGGQVTWVSSRVDSRTRTLEARAVVDNPEELLRANMFGQASIAVRDRYETVVVPEDAVQWEGCCNVVFVRRSDELYEPRKVRLGISTGAVYEVLTGLEGGEEVVTQGSFLLKTELMKGSIGAGCCEVHPGT